MNVTFSVPDGSSNHGNPNLLCSPPAWSDYLTFFFANYFAHAASVILEPGIGFRRTLVLIFAALMLPGSGVDRAVSTIWRHAIIERKNPLKRAARARALCMVLPTPQYGPFANAIRLQREYSFRNLRIWFREIFQFSSARGPRPRRNAAEIESSQYDPQSVVNEIREPKDGLEVEDSSIVEAKVHNSDLRSRGTRTVSQGQERR
jgi:hypothetical protein